MEDEAKSEGFASEALIPLESGGHLMLKGKPVTLAEFTAMSTYQQSIVQLHNDPKFKAKHKAAVKKAANTKERLAKNSENAKKNWAKPEYKAKQKAGMDKIVRDDEFKAKHSAAIRKAVNDPTVKAKHKAALKKAYSDPLVKARHKAGLLRANKDPLVKAKRKELMAKLNSDPKHKIKLSTHLIDGMAISDWTWTHKEELIALPDWDANRNVIINYLIAKCPLLKPDWAYRQRLQFVNRYKKEFDK